MTIRNSGAEAKIRAAQKRGAILAHIHAWEFTDAYTIALLLHLQRTGTYITIKSMIASGLMASLRVSGCPAPILHMTPAGAAAVHRLVDETVYAQMPAVVFPSKLNLTHVQHDLLVQRFITRTVSRKETRTAISARQIAFSKQEIGRGIPMISTKVPDAILIDHLPGETRRTAIEVQESPESDAVTERKLSQYFEAIKRQEVYGVAYASTSQARLNQVQRIWHGTLRRWWYNTEQKQWHPSHHGDHLYDEEITNTRLGLVNITDLASGLYQYAVL